MTAHPPPDTLEVPIQSPYETVPMNGTIPLYSGPIRFKTPNGEAISDGSLEVTLFGEPGVRFTTTDNAAFGFGVDGGELDIPAPAHSTPSQFLVSEFTIPPTGITEINGRVYRPGLTVREVNPQGKQLDVRSIEFHLINFKEFHGTRLHSQDGDWNFQYPGRATFKLGQWTVTLDQFIDADKRLKAAQTTGGHVFTHVGRLSRADGKLFSPDKAGAALRCLHWFLSFVNGAHSGPILPRGFRDADHVVWQTWGIPNVAPVHTGDNWFSVNPPLGCFDAADLFYKSWTDSTKNEWLHAALGNYIATNKNHGGIELTLATSQITIEMLSWVALLEENSLMSEGSFERLPAADKLRALLFWLGVETSIPKDLTELRAVHKNLDAPDSLVKMRNLVTHPTKTNRTERSKIPNGAIWQAWELNMRYAEMTILKLIGYSGVYNNRNGNPPRKLWDTLPWTRPASP